MCWSAKDEAFVAGAPELAGRMAHDETCEAALFNAREAMRLWVDTAREFGDPVPEPEGRLVFA